ncbi:hypothetical protein CZ797_05790 [Pseudoalteromonas sp. JB197]|nr:hypothetical protein CZ797_05790 [Pseudoalteromonas sp. JB197]
MASLLLSPLYPLTFINSVLIAFFSLLHQPCYTAKLTCI